MEKKVKLFTGLMAVLMISCLILNCFAFTIEMPYPVVSRILNAEAIIVLIIAAVYAAKGHQKEVSGLYKLYMIALGLFFQMSACVNAITLSSLNPLLTGILVPANALIFALHLVLATSKDLGKKNTYIICTINQTLIAIQLIGAFFAVPGVARGGSMVNTNIITMIGTQTLLVSISFIMAVMKFSDKTARQTV